MLVRIPVKRCTSWRNWRQRHDLGQSEGQLGHEEDPIVAVQAQQLYWHWQNARGRENQH